MRKSTHCAEYATLKESLAAARQSAGLSQRELARKLRVPHTWVAKVESGERRIDLIEFGWFCEACGMTAETVSCIYCGDKSSAWDHLRPIVDGRRPTGFISEIANLVPCCQPCNSSKGNSNWRAWITGSAPQSPASRGVGDLQPRIERL